MRKKIGFWIIIAALVGFAGYALAGTSFNFAAAADGTYLCPSYCQGFVTDDPAHTVGYVNIQLGTPYAPQYYNVTMSVDGATYKGTTYDPAQPFVMNGPAQITVALQYQYTRTCTHSGRGQTCVSRYRTYAGNVQF